MNLIFLRKTETLLVHFWTTIYITSEFDFYEKSRNFIGLVLAIISITSDLIFAKKKTETLLTQFWAIIYITSEYNFMEKTNTLLVQFWAIIYITSEFNFCKNLGI